MYFYPGLHHPSDARHFERCMISVNALKNRKAIVPNEWILDSGAFTEISTHGRYRTNVEDYARQIDKWSRFGSLGAAVSQDYMCEPFIIEKTGLDVETHQKLTIERYQALLTLCPNAYIMPVLQGYEPRDYVLHAEMYGSLPEWVGVGSVCKRNGNPSAIGEILKRLSRRSYHGFGIKTTSLQFDYVRDNLYSADSMAWSFAARYEGRNGNDWREAKRFEQRINDQCVQQSLGF